MQHLIISSIELLSEDLYRVIHKCNIKNVTYTQQKNKSLK